MKTSSCNCHGSQIAVADVCEGSLELPRYFPRQLLTPAEMTLEQQYFRTRLRRHNLYMHGWGVVCGAEVCRVPDDTRPAPWKVRVKPGYILGPQGDEIFLSTEQEVDLRTAGLTVGSEDPDDVWCTPVFVERKDQTPSTLYVAVRYKEIPSRPVRVQPSGCGCDDSQCELSRLRDGYEIGTLTECPASHQDPPSLENLFDGPLPTCPECPASPWVVLARIDLEPDGTIRLIDNCSCRRLVLSASNLWWRCTEILMIEPDGIMVGNEIDVAITMSRQLSPPLVFDFGDPEVTAPGNPIFQDNVIRIRVNASNSAAPGPRPLTIKDPTGHMLAFREKALTIDLPEGSETLMPMRMAVPGKPKPAPRKSRSNRK